MEAAKPHTCKRRRNIGNNANNCTAKSTRANTDRSSDNLEANTTEEEIAAFIERMDVNLHANNVESDYCTNDADDCYHLSR